MHIEEIQNTRTQEIQNTVEVQDSKGLKELKLLEKLKN